MHHISITFKIMLNQCDNIYNYGIIWLYTTNYLGGNKVFNMLKNLLNEGKEEINYNKENINQIDNSIQKSKKGIEDNIEVNQCSTLDSEVTEYTKFSPMNQELFNLMKDQLKEKDLQISKLNEILNQAQYLHKNTQILSKQQSEQELISHEDDLDDNLKKVKINMTENKELKHKGFFGILFEK